MFPKYVHVCLLGKLICGFFVQKWSTSKQKRPEQQRGVVVLLNEESDEEDSETESETGMEGGWKAVTAWYEHWVSIIENKA